MKTPKPNAPTKNGRLRFQITLSKPQVKQLKAVKKRLGLNRSYALGWLIDDHAARNFIPVIHK